MIPRGGLVAIKLAAGGTENRGDQIPNPQSRARAYGSRVRIERLSRHVLSQLERCNSATTWQDYRLIHRPVGATNHVGTSGAGVKKSDDLHIFLHTHTFLRSNYNNTKKLFFVLKDSKSAEGNLVRVRPPSRHQEILKDLDRIWPLLRERHQIL